MNDYYVYGYDDPESPDPYFYIGKGRGRRATQHLDSSQLKKNLPFYNKLRKMKELEIEPNITFLDENLTEEQAFQKEEEYIAFFGRKCDGTGCLLNLSNGGEGNSGNICSEETKEKLRQLFIGVSRSPDFIIKISKPRSAQGKLNIRKAKRKYNGIPICQYVLETGRILKVYSAIAQVKENGYLESSVRKVIYGQSSHHCGSGWRFLTPTEIEQFKKEGKL